MASILAYRSAAGATPSELGHPNSCGTVSPGSRPPRSELKKARPRFHLQIAPLLAVAIATSACSAAGGGDPALTVYNGQHEQTTIALVRSFERSTGIKVAVRSGDEATLA